MPDYPRVQPGQPLAIAAADWNGAMEAAKAYALFGGGGGLPYAGPSPTLTVLARNDTGGDLPAFVPVRLGAVLTGIVATPRDDYESAARPLFAGLACDGQGVHAVLQRALPAGEIGPAVVQGVCVARVGTGLSAGLFASPPTTGNTELVAGGGFARLLTATVGTGDRVALVQIGGGGGDGLVTLLPTEVNAGGLTEWTAARLYPPDNADGTLGVLTATVVQLHMPGGFVRGNSGLTAPPVTARRVGRDAATGQDRYRVVGVVYTDVFAVAECTPAGLATVTRQIPTSTGAG